MPSPLHALILNKSKTEARLILDELGRSDFTPTPAVIAHAGDLHAALRDASWDIIVSDFEMVDFNVLDALEILGKEAPGTPLVIFSRTITEDLAITAMRRGARDCILKDNLWRLVPAVKREIETARQRHDQKRAEKDMAAYRRQLADLVRNLPVGVYRRTPGPDGKFIMANPMIAKIFGYQSAAEFIQCNFADLFVEHADREQSYATIARDGQVEGEVLRLKKKDGTHILGLVTAHVVRNADGDIAFIDGIIEDYTQRKVSEEVMIQSEKMLSMGALAAGMAHEINNPLAGILQNTALLQLRLTRDNQANRTAAEKAATNLDTIQAYAANRDLPELLGRIQDASRRAAGIVHNMLRFARKSSSKRMPSNLATLLDRTVALAETDYDLKKKYDFRKIEIIRDYAPALPAVYCEESKVQQVFLNILSNGAEAMSGNTAAEKPRFILRAFRDGNRVRVEIEDSGPGMDAETRKRVFEPFFTTKPAGVGTGLGLSVSHFIITENHNGAIGVKSTPGRGALFFITLPMGDPQDSGGA